MSDYIAELRRELVGAAERERRRSAPRRALARTRRPLASALAGAAAVAAGVFGIAVLGREEPVRPTIAPVHVMARIGLDGIPQAATIGAGSVWITEDAGSVLRLDPDTGRVIARVPVGDSAAGVAASADAIWVVAAPQGHENRVVRIDPRINRVVARTPSFGPFDVTIAAAPGAVYVQTNKQAAGPMRRIDPATNRPEGAFGRRHVSAIAVGGDRLWTLSQDGMLEWRDAAGGRPLGRLDGFPPLAPGGSWRNGIAADATGAWVSTGDDGSVTRVSAGGKAEWTVELGADGPIALAGGSLWVTLNDVGGRNAELVRVDRANGAVTGRMALGARLPQALLPVGDDLWVMLSDSTVLVVR
jgi:outer membrane protein assembly factor BamB